MNGPEEHEARVVRLDARGCLVRLDEPLEGLEDDGHALWCSVRGRVHVFEERQGQKSSLAVGDRVRVARTAADRGAVLHLYSRTSTLSRPAVRQGRVEHVMAANVDHVLVVTSADHPPFVPGLVDRILAVVEFSQLKATVVVNKMDLVQRPPFEISTYRDLEYRVLLTSAKDGQGVDELREALHGAATMVCGHSGVGKSSLLNAVQPGLGLAVADVNPVTRRGVHTTSAAVWIPFGDDGAVVDTAGIREFGLFGIPKRDLPWLFPDLAAIAPMCRFPDCLHDHEPGCAVLSAVEEGRVAAFRFESYLRILESL